MSYVLAFDIGGTNTRFALSSSSREISRGTVKTDPTSAHATFEAAKAALEQHVGRTSLGAIAVGVAGNVDANTTLSDSGNLPGWADVNLSKLFGRIADVPVTVLNDCAAAALGEFSVANQPLVYVIWGTGVGASVVVMERGRPVVKPTELGHMIIDSADTHQCGCGGFGHLEALVGGGNLEKRFGASPDPSDANPMTRRHWDETLQSMAIGLRNLSCGDLNLPIVLGGGVITKQCHRLQQLQELVNGLRAPAAVPQLSLARLGEDSGLAGATLAARSLLVD